MSTTVKQSDRLNLRISPREKIQLLRAAQAQRQSLTDFVIESALNSAEEALASRTVFTLSPKDWRKFNELLEAPPREIPALQRLLKEKSVFEKA